MRDTILRKARESAETTLRFADENAEGLERCARAVAARLADGGRLLAIGNGGSACDASHLAVEFGHPIVEKRRPLPALALGSDLAWVTAIGNDRDFSRVFVEPLEVLASPGDVLVALSTSGASTNVERAVVRARALGLLTVGITGRDGGRLVEACHHCFVVPSWSVHRIQETHTLVVHLLWDLVHVALGADDVL